MIQANIENDIVSCIKDIGRIEKHKLVDILCGNEDFMNSPFYGIYREHPISDIMYYIDELVRNDILNSQGLFEVLTVNVIKSEEPDILPINTDDITDKNILKIIKLIRNEKNIFITGHAGTGKSYILDKLKNLIPKLVVTSTTGIAAVNVGGQTIHSWTGIGICNKPVSVVVENILSNYSQHSQIKNCKLLAVDEISMLNINTFEYINEVLKQVRDNNKPFGGIQVIFIGDFFQLPPVENRTEEEPKKKYCFESELWEQMNFHPVVLTKNYRQNEQNLIRALSHIRTNKLTKKDIELLKSREVEDSNDLSDMLHIFSTNEEVRRYNQQRFSLLNGKLHFVEAIDTLYANTNVLNFCKAEEYIYLKVGARVMLLVNLNFEKGLINGSCGTVTEVNTDDIVIKFDNGVCESIQRFEFEFYKNDKLIASRKQFPLQLAYAITTHKSQGMTLDKLFVDFSRFFENGQTYVALSRIKTLDGLHISNFNPHKIKVDDKIVEFYKQLKG
ncbi:MAG: AAA family ATPase [Cyanobacteria bacterium RUI128]|nr:AAA family ATPase [Cyanobacteria bacterium RUI128]